MADDVTLKAREIVAQRIELIARENGDPMQAIQAVEVREGSHDDRLSMLAVIDAIEALSKDAEVTPVIDLDRNFWEQLVQAASESNWIPQEHYYMNDWVNDCVEYLRFGNGETAADRITALQRANEKLREALDEIAYARWPSVNGDDPVRRIQGLARAAINALHSTGSEGQH